PVAAPQRAVHHGAHSGQVLRLWHAPTPRAAVDVAIAYPTHVGSRRLGSVTSDPRRPVHIRRAGGGPGSRPRSRAAKLGARARRRMFGIPEWAVGVGFIIVAVSIAKAVAGRIGPPDRHGRPRGSRRDLARAVEDLQQRVGGSDDVQTRLDALEDEIGRASGREREWRG